MNRRELLAGAAMMPGFVLTQEQVLRGIGVFVSPEAEAHFRSLPKPYDPVAVLEAMRERGYCFSLSTGWPPACEVDTWITVGKNDSPLESAVPMERFPDFPSAVRWLHRQAAAADAEFAKQFPVPE